MPDTNINRLLRLKEESPCPSAIQSSDSVPRLPIPDIFQILSLCYCLSTSHRISALLTQNRLMALWWEYRADYVLARLREGEIDAALAVIHGAKS